MQRIRIIAAKVTAVLGVALLLASGGLPAIHAHATATATVIAGAGADGPMVNDIPALNTQFWNPADVITTTDGVIYIADTNHNEIRSIGADGIIHAAFGNGVAGCATSGGTQTQLYSPTSMVRDSVNNIFVATGCGQIIKFTPGDPVGVVVAGKFDGSGNANPVTHDGMIATDVTIQPGGLSYDSASTAIYFTDAATFRVLKLLNGTISIAAGNGTLGFSGDGGPATAAQFYYAGNTLFSNGNLYVADGSNCRIRMVDPDGIISTIVGTGNCNDLNDNGPGTSASISSPGDMAMDANGILYFGSFLSGGIYTYDTDTKNVAPVLSLSPDHVGGMAFDNEGNLLALGTGSTQQLFKVTGLAPTIPDTTQHGSVTGVSWNVTPTTPLWNMDVTVNTTGVTCPAVVAVTVGTWQKRATVCALGETAPATTNFRWKVFNTNRSLEPDSVQNVTAFITKSDAPHYGTSVTTLTVPKRPTIVGVGDSYLSGHHQLDPGVTCVRPDGTPPESTLCSLYSNDPSYSWVTLMAGKLNAKAPAQWQFEYDSDHLLARSGATTRQMYEEGQVAAMQAFITQHAGSWNVVAFDGGANNINFAGALKDFYTNHPLSGNGIALAPWEAKKLSDCPDSDLLSHYLFGFDTDPNAPPLPVPLPPA